MTTASMTCDKCASVLEEDEASDIIKLRSMGLTPPCICTECADDLFLGDDEPIPVS